MPPKDTENYQWLNKIKLIQLPKALKRNIGLYGKTLKEVAEGKLHHVTHSKAA